MKNTNHHQGTRSFGKDDLVYAKVHSTNSWRWALAVVLERIGNVMFHVWMEDRRMLRSQINQLHRRTCTDHTPELSLISSKAGKYQFVLDMLLQVCNLHQSSHAQSARRSPPRPSLLPTSAPSVPVAQMSLTLANTRVYRKLHQLNRSWSGCLQPRRRLVSRPLCQRQRPHSHHLRQEVRQSSWQLY